MKIVVTWRSGRTAVCRLDGTITTDQWLDLVDSTNPHQWLTFELRPGDFITCQSGAIESVAFVEDGAEL